MYGERNRTHRKADTKMQRTIITQTLAHTIHSFICSLPVNDVQWMLECWHALPSSSATCIEFVSSKCTIRRNMRYPITITIEPQPKQLFEFRSGRHSCSMFILVLCVRPFRHGMNGEDGIRFIFFSQLRWYGRAFGRKSKEDRLIVFNRIISFAHQIKYSVSVAKLSSSMALIETEPPCVLC